MSGRSVPEFLQWDMVRLSEALRERQLSPVEVTRCLLERIEQLNPLVNAFITVMAEEALDSAAQAEADDQDVVDLRIVGALPPVQLRFKHPVLLFPA